MTSSSLVILQSFPSTPHQHQHSISDFWRNFHNFKHSHPPSQPWRNNLFRLFPCLLFFKKYCVRWLWRRISLPFFPYPSFYLLFKCVKRPPTVLPLPTLCSKTKRKTRPTNSMSISSSAHFHKIAVLSSNSFFLQFFSLLDQIQLSPLVLLTSNDLVPCFTIKQSKRTPPSVPKQIGTEPIVLSLAFISKDHSLGSYSSFRSVWKFFDDERKLSSPSKKRWTSQMNGNGQREKWKRRIRGTKEYRSTKKNNRGSTLQIVIIIIDEKIRKKIYGQAKTRSALVNNNQTLSI